MTGAPASRPGEDTPSARLIPVSFTYIHKTRVQKRVLLSTQPTGWFTSTRVRALVPRCSLTDGGTEEVADTPGEGEADGAADDHAEDGAADGALADAGAGRAGQTQGDQDDDDRARDPPRVGREQDGDQREQRAKGEGRGRGARRLEGVGQVFRVDVQFGVEMGGQRVVGG